MITIHTIALFLSWLAVFIAGTCATDFALRMLAKRGVRTTYEPGCEKCGESAACYVNAQAECWDCVNRKVDEEMESNQREYDEELASIQRETHEEMARIERDFAQPDTEETT